MGVEIVVEVINSVFRPLINIASGGSLSRIIAVTGISILFMMAIVYVVYGFIKLGKLLWNLRLKSLALGLTVVGIVLICLAIVLPY